jgi:hypothetical protein
MLRYGSALVIGWIGIRPGWKLREGVLPLRQRRERVKKTRKNYIGEEQGCDLEAASAGAGADFQLCDELGLQPTVFYRWQEEFFENGATAFQTKARSDHQAEKNRSYIGR